jgi:hypothetical protein
MIIYTINDIRNEYSEIIAKLRLPYHKFIKKNPFTIYLGEEISLP